MASELTDETLEELERLEQAATRGWVAYFTNHGDPYVVTDPRRWSFTKVCTVNPDSAEDYGRANTLFIAAIRDNAPSLLAEVRRLRREVGDLRERLNGKTVAYPAGYEEALKVVEAAQKVVDVIPLDSTQTPESGIPQLSYKLTKFREATGGQAADGDTPNGS